MKRRAKYTLLQLRLKTLNALLMVIRKIIQNFDAFDDKNRPYISETVKSMSSIISKLGNKSCWSFYIVIMY